MRYEVIPAYIIYILYGHTHRWVGEFHLNISFKTLVEFMNYDIKSRFSLINGYKSLDFDTRPQDHVTLLVYRTSYTIYSNFSNSKVSSNENGDYLYYIRIQNNYYQTIVIVNHIFYPFKF